MAVQAYYTWRDKGSPYSVATPINELVTWARAHGINILGVIGNTAHLTSNNPQDHTPFSYTAWPLPLPGYIVTACDIEQGAWADKFIDETRRGLHPWVKYINHKYKQYNFKNGYNVYDNSDYHCHVSCRTDHLNTHINMNPQPTPVVTTGRKTMKLVHKLNPVEFALVGDQWHPVTGQDRANALAKVFGDSLQLTAAEFDYVKTTFSTEGQ